MDTERSTRLATTLLATSTTPRTTRRQMELLAHTSTEQNATRDERLYLEVKHAMAVEDVDAARALVAHLPPHFRSADAYLRQCDVYDTLCRDGLIERTGCDALRMRLSTILSEAKDARSVHCYADALARHGYNDESLASMTLFTVVDAADVAGMCNGHRILFIAYAERNTPLCARTWMKTLHAFEQCSPVLVCWKQSSRQPTRHSLRDGARRTDTDVYDQRTAFIDDRLHGVVDGALSNDGGGDDEDENTKSDSDD